MTKKIFFYSLFYVVIAMTFLPYSAFGDEQQPVLQTTQSIQQPNEGALNDCHLTIEFIKDPMQKVTIYSLTKEDQESNYPFSSHIESLNTLCMIDVSDKITYDSKGGARVIFHDLSFQKNSAIFYWEGEQGIWIKLDSQLESDAQSLSALVHQPYLVFGAFNDLSETRKGIASWYHHPKTPGGSATNLYPLGTKLKITNTENNKSITVRVTSTWTQTNKNRVIDIEKASFKKIARTQDGLIKVKIEKLKT